MANVYTGAEPYGYEHEGGGIFKHVSWGAIFAGAVVSLVVILVLTLLGMGIGFAVINPATEQNPFAGIGIGTAIWLGITALLALFAGGWATAKLAGSLKGVNGILHSIVMWGVVTIFSFFVMTTAIGSLIGGAAGLLGKGVSAVTGAVPEMMQQGGAGAGAGGGAVSPQVQQELMQMIRNLFAGGQTSISDIDRESLVNALASRTQMSRAEAESTVNSMIQQYQQMAQSAPQMAQTAMDSLATASIWIFVLMLLEAGAAALGGWLGARKKPEVVHT